MGAQDWGSKAPKIFGLTAGSTVSLDPTLGTIFTLTPGETETINATSAGSIGEEIILQVNTSGTSSYTLTFGTKLRSTGTLATGTTDARRFNVTFVSDGLGWSEKGRTAAQA